MAVSVSTAYTVNTTVSTVIVRDYATEAVAASTAADNRAMGAS